MRINWAALDTCDSESYFDTFKSIFGEYCEKLKEEEAKEKAEEKTEEN